MPRNQFKAKSPAERLLPGILLEVAASDDDDGGGKEAAATGATLLVPLAEPATVIPAEIIFILLAQWIKVGAHKSLVTPLKLSSVLTDQGSP